MLHRRRRRVEVEALEQRLAMAAPQPVTQFSLPDGLWQPSPFQASPIFADLNNDGREELITAAPGSKLIAYSMSPTGGLTEFKTYQVPGTTAQIKSTQLNRLRRFRVTGYNRKTRNSTKATCT